ncbi:hypothetical protein Tc00.1047053506499.60 [Trypanosoma cruzi]|uniref:Uncharacterized protein n=1 Tax=Trypanosoma cruzi (strain CL Brener) TaxID=353153 RepID=Q4DU17_TRYCC|nr:hypothetical protein Tc00.1047053506499.60 [Trypanosoma cruzi]EAN96005.1 hypothetical protein Tc00.1047053506499.60 [Trypanosoma cruzi]|eukprot:XP_817856.1 hypothetical protein [Trypanosoma cruzi strain CL Brener]
MHGQRHKFRVDKGAQIPVIMVTCMAFVLCECTMPKYLPERERIGFQADRCIFRWCTNAKGCCTTVAVQYFRIVEVSGGRTRRNYLDTVVQNTLWTQPTRKDCMVCWDAPAPHPAEADGRVVRSTFVFV